MNSLSIAMQPGVESLNAALATGIALYLWRKGLKKT
jgi:tRNA G18 (ribose-2'-O)-methylase SpoU